MEIESKTTPNYAAMTAGEMHTALGADAQKWAEAFCQYNIGMDREMMTGWFANAMMAMHDFLKGGCPINGDHAQYLIDQARGDGIDNGKI